MAKEDAFEELSKAAGGQRAGHKYSKRTPDGKGGYHYEYENGAHENLHQHAMHVDATVGTPDHHAARTDLQAALYMHPDSTINSFRQRYGKHLGNASAALLTRHIDRPSTHAEHVAHLQHYAKRVKNTEGPQDDIENVREYKRALAYAPVSALVEHGKDHKGPGLAQNMYASQVKLRKQGADNDWDEYERGQAVKKSDPFRTLAQTVDIDLSKAFPPKKKPGASEPPNFDEPAPKEQPGNGPDEHEEQAQHGEHDDEQPDSPAPAAPPGQEPDNDGDPGDGSGDADGDGIPDEQDPDDDADGIPDADEEHGDLDEDPDELAADAASAPGDVQGLVAQLAEAERNYYAARGFHGSNHHKADALLHAYHKVVHQLVRTLVGSQASAGATADPDESNQQGEPGDEAPPDKGAAAGIKGKQQPGPQMTFGAPQQQPGQDGATEGPPQAQGAPGKPSGPPQGVKGAPAPSGKPQGSFPAKGKAGPPGAAKPGAAAKPSPFGGKPAQAGAGVPPKKKASPFGKSLGFPAEDIQIPCLGSFAGVITALRSNGGTLDYLHTFFDVAYDFIMTCGEPGLTVQDVAPMVVQLLSAFIPSNAILANGVQKHLVDVDSVGTYLANKEASAGHTQALGQSALHNESPDLHTNDRASLRALGGDELFRSMRHSAWMHEELGGSRVGVQLQKRAPRLEGLVLEVDEDPREMLQKSQEAAQRRVYRIYEDSAPVHVTVDANCPHHGRDLFKSQTAHIAGACSCPKG